MFLLTSVAASIIALTDHSLCLFLCNRLTDAGAGDGSKSHRLWSSVLNAIVRVRAILISCTVFQKRYSTDDEPENERLAQIGGRFISVRLHVNCALRLIGVVEQAQAKEWLSLLFFQAISRDPSYLLAIGVASSNLVAYSGRISLYDYKDLQFLSCLRYFAHSLLKGCASTFASGVVSCSDQVFERATQIPQVTFAKARCYLSEASALLTAQHD